jgi:hypothetical protein
MPNGIFTLALAWILDNNLKIPTNYLTVAIYTGFELLPLEPDIALLLPKLDSSYS